MEKVVGSMSDWAGLLKDFFRQIHDGSITLEMLKALNEHRNPFAEAIQFAQSYADRLIVKAAKTLSKRFGKKIAVDPLPVWLTEENLAKAAKFNLQPIFLPDEEIGQDRPMPNWVKPNSWFYDQIVAGRRAQIAQDSAELKRGWYLADFTIGANYDDGRQVFQNDPLSSIITGLREAGQVGKDYETSLGSRFAIVPQDEWPLVLAELAKELGLSPNQVRLERAIEFNAISNLYDQNRGRFDMWEWFADIFGGSSRLCGGRRDSGGLACVSGGVWAGPRGGGLIAGRPLVSF